MKKIEEDPATASPNECLAGYVVKHEYFGKNNILIPAWAGILDRKVVIDISKSKEGV